MSTFFNVCIMVWTSRSMWPFMLRDQRTTGQPVLKHIRAEMSPVITSHTLWYSFFCKDWLNLTNNGATVFHWARDHINEWKLRIIITHEKICLGVYDKYISSRYLPSTGRCLVWHEGPMWLGMLHLLKRCAQHPQCHMVVCIGASFAISGAAARFFRMMISNELW